MSASKSEQWNSLRFICNGYKSTSVSHRSMKSVRECEQNVRETKENDHTIVIVSCLCVLTFISLLRFLVRRSFTHTKIDILSFIVNDDVCAFLYFIFFLLLFFAILLNWVPFWFTILFSYIFCLANNMHQPNWKEWKQRMWKLNRELFFYRPTTNGQHGLAFYISYDESKLFLIHFVQLTGTNSILKIYK